MDYGPQAETSFMFGYLQAVWPGFCWVRFGGLAGPGGQGTPSNCGGVSPPHFFEGSPGTAEPARPQ
jgi:hypothetical protein